MRPSGKSNILIRILLWNSKMRIYTTGGQANRIVLLSSFEKPVSHDLLNNLVAEVSADRYPAGLHEDLVTFNSVDMGY